MLVFQKNNLFAYRIAYRIDSLDVRTVNGKDIRDLRTHWVFRYFVKEKDENEGFLIDSARPNLNGWYPADSIFMKNGFWINAQNFYDVFRRNTAVLNTQKILPSGNMAEIYLLSGVVDPGYRGVLYLEFSNDFEGSGFSICSQLDSIRNKKLVKTRIINKKRYLQAYDMYVDEFVSHDYELKEIAIDEDARRAEKYFEVYATARRSRMTSDKVAGSNTGQEIQGKN